MKLQSLILSRITDFLISLSVNFLYLVISLIKSMNFLPYLNHIVSVRDRKDINLFILDKFYSDFFEKKLSTIRIT